MLTWMRNTIDIKRRGLREGASLLEVLPGVDPNDPSVNMQNQPEVIFCMLMRGQREIAELIPTSNLQKMAVFTPHGLVFIHDPLYKLALSPLKALEHQKETDDDLDASLEDYEVDLSTFKATLKQLNIFVWKEVNGSLVTIHGGDYEITILIKNIGKHYVVKATDSFEDVIRMLEKQLKLSPGCYKLTYKHPNRSVGKVWVKTDRDWDIAVLLSKVRGYFVLLYLEVFASSQAADEDACDDDACFEGACDEDVTDDDFYVDDLDEYEYFEEFYVEDAFNEDACDENLMELMTEEAIRSLNNGSVTFEDARALFHVSLYHSNISPKLFYESSKGVFVETSGSS
ncbi:hypothetical protein Tco_0720964 [Tanacetum coccineum]